MKKFIKTKFIAVSLAVTIMLIPAETVSAATRPSFCNAKEWAVLRLTNEKRMANGLDAVTTFLELQDVCDIRAKEIIQSFSHTRPDGTTCFTALDNLMYYSTGENIAAGQTTAASVMNAWWNSPGHKANILTSGFDHMGVGYEQKSSSTYKNYWVQMFIGGGCSIDRIAVNNVKNNNYKKGTSIKDMKRYVKVVCDHGISYMPLSAKMCSGYKKNKTGKQTITVKYKGFQTTFDVVIE